MWMSQIIAVHPLNIGKQLVRRADLTLPHLLQPEDLLCLGRAHIASECMLHIAFIQAMVFQAPAIGDIVRKGKIVCEIMHHNAHPAKQHPLLIIACARILQKCMNPPLQFLVRGLEFMRRCDHLRRQIRQNRPKIKCLLMTVKLL